MPFVTSPWESCDLIVCGARAFGSVVVRRMAGNWAVLVLLVEAGGTAQVIGDRAADLIRMEHGL